MSRFYVGQRVRIVRSFPDDRGEAVIGTETIVNEIDAENEAGQRGLIGVTVNGDPNWCFMEEHLEPLTDPGREVVEWSKCLWQPEHLHVSA